MLMFPPFQLQFDAKEQTLDFHGQISVGDGQSLPFQIQFQGEATIQALRAFRRLLDHVDEEELAAETPRGLQ